MRKHPMVVAYVKALIRRGGKEYAEQFNMYGLEQKFCFG